MLDYLIDFYQCNKFLLNKDELIIYRDLIRECKYHLSQSRDDEISGKSLFTKMKAHHYIILLLGEPETDEERKEYDRYVDIQYESGKNLNEMLEFIDLENQKKAEGEKEFLRKANKKTDQELEKIYFRKILALKQLALTQPSKCKPEDIEYSYISEIQKQRSKVGMSNIEYLNSI